jgi:hypothetical protein
VQQVPWKFRQTVNNESIFGTFNAASFNIFYRKFKVIKVMSKSTSIFVVNSSDTCADFVASILKTQIRSEKRPYFACLSYDEFKDEINVGNFFENFVNNKLMQCRKALAESNQLNEFNQLEAWKVEVSSRAKEERALNRIRSDFENQSKILMKCKGIIVDFPIHSDVELYLILFDIYNCSTLKSIASLHSPSMSLEGIINLHSQQHHNSIIKFESFWHELLSIKFHNDFNNVAFLDMRVPVESNCVLDKRSQLIYNQFCHYCYDFDNLKCKYKQFYESLNIIELPKLGNNHEEELRQLQNHLNEIPHSMTTIEYILDAIVNEIEQTTSTSFILQFHDDKDEIKNSCNPVKIEIFCKTFFDMNDTWQRAYDENPNFYTHEIHKLEHSFSEDIWQHNNIATISIERREILNYFMNKILRYIESVAGGKQYLLCSIFGSLN